MKALPCTYVPCPNQSAEGVMRGRATLRDKSLYLMGRPPVAFPYSYPCRGCGRKSTLSAIDWNRLQDLSLAELDGLKMLEALTKDLRGAGWSASEAVDLFSAGFSGPATLEPFERKGNA